MKKHLLLTVTLLLMLTACARLPIHLQDRAAESHQVPFQKLIVDNLSTTAKIGVGEIVYVNGWAPAHSGFEPPLNEAFVSKIKNSIIATGVSGRVDVSVLRVGFFVEKNVADDVVLIGMFMLGRERGFKCDADVNVKTDNESRRMTLSHEIRRPYFDDDEQVRTFVETCQSDLIKQLANTISNPLESR